MCYSNQYLCCVPVLEDRRGGENNGAAERESFPLETGGVFEAEERGTRPRVGHGLRK